MTQRSIRRAAERKARKEQERKERNKLLHNSHAEESHESQEPAFKTVAALSEAPETIASYTTTATRLTPINTISEARLKANRANAQLSTGPTSSDGKNTVSVNAVKTGLTGQSVLLPSDDVAQYQRHVEGFENEFSPVGARETELVQSMADTAWRLRRIPALEMAIYAKGRIQFAGLFEDQDEATRPSLIDAQTFLTYEKQLRNLHLQESRLYRRYEKEKAELRQLQQSRRQSEQEAFEQAAMLYQEAKKANQSFHPADFGFEFSTAQIEQYVQGMKVHAMRLSTVNQRTQAACM